MIGQLRTCSTFPNLFPICYLKTVSRLLNQDDIYGGRQLLSLAGFTSHRMNQTQLYSTEESAKLVANNIFTVGVKMANQQKGVPLEMVVWTH